MYAPQIHELLSAHRAPLGGKPLCYTEQRKAEASRLTSLMRRGGGFSFVRLGDFDLALLLAGGNVSDNTEIFPSDSIVTGTQPLGSPGLTGQSVSRLRAALEQSHYLDRWECQWKDTTLLDRLSLQRRSDATSNPNSETSCILPTWVEHEFKTFCEGRRILFCGGEAKLLETLLQEDDFRRLVSDYWPENAQCYFLEPRERGQNLEHNLDLIKQDLAEFIKANRIDTLFLSLGGGAKILCCEFARELGIVAIDFGALMRSLTYSGSDGHRTSRSTHTVFLYRVPFSLYMDSLEKVMPQLTPEEFLAKAHAQLLLEVLEKEVGWSHSAWEHDFSAQNRIYFQEGYRAYRRRYARIFNANAATIKERRDFLHFCGMHRLTLGSRLFFKWFQLRGLIKLIIQRLGSCTGVKGMKFSQ